MLAKQIRESEPAIRLAAMGDDDDDDDPA